MITTLVVALPFLFVAAVAGHQPRDAAGHRVTRHRRSFTGDVRSFLGFAAY